MQLKTFREYKTQDKLICEIQTIKQSQLNKVPPTADRVIEIVWNPEQGGDIKVVESDAFKADILKEMQDTSGTKVPIETVIIKVGDDSKTFGKGL